MQSGVVERRSLGLATTTSIVLGNMVGSGVLLLPAINTCAALTMWALLGRECATVPAGRVKEPEKTIPRATLLGTAIAAAAKLLWGGWAGNLIAIAALISCFGALNGWILMQGQFPPAVADDGLFPKFFAKESRRGTPAWGLVVSSIFATIEDIVNWEMRARRSVG